ncbi:SusC/RagA family TonB-linked outer membrane protein [Spongiimicrobium sp. 3-5]|uniref:SusC/RagA family TonB-linked outer membrane protein n=1 Tax=Spongiimicrobium sp. 3-5 TaxID=3332596 RepID=UPI0039808FFC
MNLKILSLSLLFMVVGNFISYAQNNITVKGIVTSSADSFPLPDANVLIKGTLTGVTTDFNGIYTIEVPSTETILVFSYQGYKTLELSVGSLTNIDVALDEDVSKLDEIVLIGYGSSSRKDLTGAISSIKAKDLEAITVTSPDEFVQGRVPGLVLTQTSGQPGGSSSIRIRGTSSILAGNEPLYVIDGVIVESNNANQSSGVTEGPPINALSTINPSDIESIDVLKDASATAIYGSRGASGVIIIKTKRGYNGQVKVNFDSYLGIQTVVNELNLLNGEQFAHYINEANYNAGMPRTYTNPASFGQGTDWQKALYRDAIIQNYDISARGGNENVKYAMSTSYLEQEGVIVGTDFDRINFRVNLDFRISDKASIENTSNISRTNFNTTNAEGGIEFGKGSAVSRAYVFSPLLPVFDADGNYTKANFVVGDDGSFFNSTDNKVFQNGTTPLVNPIADIALNESTGKNTRILNNLVFKWNILPNVDFKTSLGVDFLFNDESVFRTADIDFTPTGSAASAFRAKQLSSNWMSETTLSYSNTFNDKHRINAFVGFSGQESKIDNISAVVLGFPVENFGTDNLGLGLDFTANSLLSKKTLISYFGRANYTYDDKYILTLTGRYDGASVFGKDNSWAFFPSAAFAWNLYEENFIENLNVFSYLKLRVGYGEVGNSDIAPFSSLARYRVAFHYFGDTAAQGFIPISPANSDLGWEISKQFNAGLDMNFFNDKLGITLDYYDKTTDDLLLQLQTPVHTGQTQAVVNAGNVKNSGFELAINTKNFSGKNFNWSTNLSLSYNENEITSLAGLDQISSGFSANGISEWQRLVEGGEIGAFYGYVSDGIAQLSDDISSIPHFQTETLVPGERKYKDLNGDGIINADDRTFIGNPNPEYSFGINNTFNYKGFDLNVFLQGVSGNEVVNFNRYNIEALDGQSNATLEAFSNRWTPQNPSNTYTRAVTGGRINRFSDYYVEDGAYLRLKSVSLGYTLPSKLMSKLKMNRLRLYVTGKNLLTFTDYSGVDPEVSVGGQDNNLSAGGDFGSYPATRTILVGLNVNF